LESVTCFIVFFGGFCQKKNLNLTLAAERQQAQDGVHPPKEQQQQQQQALFSLSLFKYREGGFTRFFSKTKKLTHFRRIDLNVGIE